MRDRSGELIDRFTNSKFGSSYPIPVAAENHAEEKRFKQTDKWIDDRQMTDK